MNSALLTLLSTVHPQLQHKIPVSSAEDLRHASLETSLTPKHILALDRVETNTAAAAALAQSLV